jgi:REP element-mobilizing transposase RayT
MARPLRINYVDAYYHVSCRGNDRRETFRDDQDRRAFLQRVQRSLEIYGVKLHGYVLMTNHFHLIVQTSKENLSEFRRHLSISYTAQLESSNRSAQ